MQDPGHSTFPATQPAARHGTVPCPVQLKQFFSPLPGPETAAAPDCVAVFVCFGVAESPGPHPISIIEESATNVAIKNLAGNLSMDPISEFEEVL